MIEKLMTIVMGLILLIAFLPIINTLVDTATASNMSSLAYGGVMILILTLSGLFAVLMFIQSLFGKKDEPNQGQYYGGQ